MYINTNIMNKITPLILSLAMSSGAMAASHGVDLANLDPSVSPAQDFYQYACGGWMKAHPLQPEYSRFGVFDLLAELNRKQLYDLVMGLDASKAAPGSNEQKIADIFAMGMDSVRLNREGAAPIMKDLKRINGANREEIVDLMATLPGVGVFFGTGVEADMKDANTNAMYWNQGGLGLGDRDYYIVDGEQEKAVLNAYRTYLQKTAQLAGYSEKDAKRLADNSIKIETELARAAMSREELRDPAASYNPMKLSDMQKSLKVLDMRRYFSKQGLDNVETVIVGQPKSLAAVDSILANADIQALRDYMAADYMSSAARYLSDDFGDAAFELSKVMSGVQQQQPRWKRALNVPNGMLGEALGELYVERYFPASSKTKMLEIVGNLKTALGQHIDNLTWMSDVTKAKAHEKLNTFTVKIGYPDKWKDYSKFVVDPKKSYWENVQAAIMFNQEDNLSEFGKPVDKTKWYMSPQTVNAYYSPLTNEICFPAGILQAPYFDPAASDAENYGAIGVVIGHEMTHGFDDQGRNFDKDGNLKDWWTPADAQAFNKLADGLVAQFDSIKVLGDTHANGRFTLGENIADQGGLRVSHTAFHNAMKAAGTPDDQKVEGFTPDQRFYLAYASLWANNIRDAEILKRTKSDPHSLGRWRVNASIRNLEPYFKAFDVKPGDKMWRPVEERVVIW